MADMRVKDFDDFRSPSRRPWLLLLVLVIVALVCMRGMFRREEAPGPAHGTEPDNSAQDDGNIKVSRSWGDDSQSGDPSSDDASADNQRTSDIADSDDVKQMLLEARDAVASEHLPDARNIYLSILGQEISRQTRVEVEKELGKVNVKLVMSPWSIPEKVTYVVESGDSLQKIANKFGATVDLLAKSNNIPDPDRIRKGDILRVLKATFKIEVSKKRNDLLLLMNDKFFKRYKVGTGKYGKTPVGTFKITKKIKEPPWWRPDNVEVPYTGDPKGENILGTRWMTVFPTGDTRKVSGYGIHGTWQPDTIGKAASAGCVRMLNSDVEELFTLVPGGTSVVIVE